MPVKLPSGLVVVNVTPHDLIFYNWEWGEEPVTVPSDEVLNANVDRRVVKEEDGIEYVELTFIPKRSGRVLISSLKQEFPGALLVGSIVAAQAYREDVVAPVPWYRGDRGWKRSNVPLMKPNKFTIYLKEKN